MSGWLALLIQIWALCGAALLSGCVLRLRPVTVAMMMPPAAGLFLFVRALV